jgi:Spy/CpxP family protein refolding chaperone
MGKVIRNIALVLSLSLNLALLIAYQPWKTVQQTLPGVGKLSSLQLENLQKIRWQMQPRYQETRIGLNEKQAELLNLLKKEKVDQIELDHCLAEIGKLQLDLQKLAVSEIIQSKEWLSRNQKERLLDGCAQEMGYCIKNGMVCLENK